MSLALILQISPEEVPQADELVALLCDIESRARKDVEFILFKRKDVEYADSKRLLDRLSSKFNRSKVVECWDFATGWPHGPNTMWCCLIRQMFHMRRMDELAADGCLTFECDCIPIRHDWIDLLSKAWDDRSKDKEVVGHFHGLSGEGGPTHVNGNAIFATNFWEKHQDLLGCHGELPWDVAFANHIMPVAEDTPLINQWYRMDHFTLQDWKRLAKTPCALFHGVKVPEGREIAREMLIDYASKPSKRR